MRRLERGDVGVDDGVQLERRRHGAARVVAARERDAEQGHDLVADELVHGAAVPLDDGHGIRLDPGHQRLDLFRIEGLVERRVAGQVGEHDRGVAPFAVLGRRPSRRHAARRRRRSRCRSAGRENAAPHCGQAHADRRAARGAEPGADRDSRPGSGHRSSASRAAGKRHHRPRRRRWQALSGGGRRPRGPGPLAQDQGRALRGSRPAYNHRLFCVLPSGCAGSARSSFASAPVGPGAPSCV